MAACAKPLTKERECAEVAAESMALQKRIETNTGGVHVGEITYIRYGPGTSKHFCIRERIRTNMCTALNCFLFFCTMIYSQK